MLKKHMAACLVVTAFAAAPAFAQTAATPSSPTDRPAASGSSSTTTGSPAMTPGTSTMSQSSAASGQFMTKLDTNQIMASDLIGTKVVSANNESIGDINDVILGRDGQAKAAVVGVGGFLGIGEKDVAVPFGSLEFLSAQQAQAADSANRNVATTGSTATGNTTATGTAPSTGMATTNTAANDHNKPERVMLRMTKAELQAAPAFDEDGDANNTTTGTTGTTRPATPQ